MSQVAAVNYGGEGTLDRLPIGIMGRAAPYGATLRPAWPVDTLRIQNEAANAFVAFNEPRIQQLRHQIAAEVYLTDEKLDVAIDQLHKVLKREPDLGQTTAAYG